MKTNLEVLIEHVQSEYDYLKSSMDECVAEWDFDGAKAFKESILYTRSKLNVLRRLENANYHGINQLEEMISQMERSLIERKFDNYNLDELSRQKMEEHFIEKIKKRIEKSKQKLVELKAIVPPQSIDSDKIIELLDSLERNEISEIEFEIIKENIFLVLSVLNDKAELEFRSSENGQIEDYQKESAKSILVKLGFNIETYKKQISDFKSMGKMKFIEELAIIYFEVFEIYGGNVNLKIKYNSK